MAYVNLGQVIYPVGSIYQSSNNTSPANLFGGSWSALTDQKFWLPSNSYNSTGGEWSHTLSIAEMPAHVHHQNVTSNIVAGHGQRIDWGGDGRCSPFPQGIDTDEVGGSKSHNNMPPYRTCFCWVRTA